MTDSRSSQHVLRLDSPDVHDTDVGEQPGKPRRPRRVAVGIGLLAVAAGSVIVSHQPAQATNTVVIDVEGARKTVETRSTVVADILDDAGVVVEPADAVDPARDATLDDGEVVTIVRARSIVLDVDGVTSAVEVPAVTAAGVVDTLDVAEPGAEVTSSRDGVLPTEVTTRITVRNPVPVTVVADGVTRNVLTPAAPAEEILADHDIAVGPDDLVEVVSSDMSALTSIDGAASVGAGDRVVVIRITTVIEERDTVLAAPDGRRESATMIAGDTRVEQVGVPGLRRDIYEVTFHNGGWFSETLTATVETPPVPSITVVGTATSAAATKNWAALAECESGGNPTIVSSTGKYHGLYQFDSSTWRGVGGAGLPSQATPEEQTLRAMTLYDMNGARPWPVCGRHL